MWQSKTEEEASSAKTVLNFKDFLLRINISFPPFTRTASRKDLSHWISGVFVVPTPGHNQQRTY
jgi:hypothetical protein